MNSKYISMALVFAAAVGFTACDDDDLSSKSVLDDFTLQTEDAKPEVQEFDKWLAKNYNQEYNIDFRYRYSDLQTDQVYNVVPAQFDKARGLAILVKHIWLDAYKEVAGEEFIKTYAPRIIQLIGSYEYNDNGSIVLGTANGGLKIMLYGVNELDMDNIRINSNNLYESHDKKPQDLNYWYFHTMHHEFCHILTQTKNYSTEFQTISSGSYHATDWINLKDEKAATEGFVTGYASEEYNEDFAEMYSNYITLDDQGWNAVLNQAGDKKDILLQKLSIVREYFKNSWGIDIEQIRSVVLRRSEEAPNLDLRTLN